MLLGYTLGRKYQNSGHSLGPYRPHVRIEKETELHEHIKREHNVDVKLGGEKVKGSPWTPKSFDSRKLAVSNMPTSSISDKPVHFNIDASEAGSGNIEIRVNDGRVPCSVENCGNHKFLATFQPENGTGHTVELSFNGRPVQGSPWTIDMVNRQIVKLQGKNRINACKKAALLVLSGNQKLSQEDFNIKINGPNNEAILFNLTSESSGDTEINYTPITAGDYTINVTYAGTSVIGSPFVAKAYNISAITVTSLDDGFVNQPMFFTIDVGEAGEGQLQIMVNNGNIPNEVDPLEAGRYKIKFIPTDAGQQVVDIRFNDIDVPGSPLKCLAQDVTANILDLQALIPVQTENSFLVQTAPGLSSLSREVTVTAPSGENIPARLIQQSDGDYKVEWTPTHPGRHAVDVTFGGQQVQGSPFYIDVFDIHKIRVNNFYHGDVNDKAGFRIDCSQAGQGDQEIRVVSPSGRNVTFDLEESSPLDYNVVYTPTESGQHKVHISYSGMELNGSPFHQEILEGALPSATGDGLHKGEEDKPASFNIDSQGMNGEPMVQVDGPNSIAKCSIDPMTDGQFKVTYIPVEVGLYDVIVRWNGKDLHGSPFHPKIVDSRKVRVVGGWQHYMDSNERIHLVVGEEKEIPFDTSEAGPGHLRAEVKSPTSFLPVTVDDEVKGKSMVKFIPQEEGSHYIHLYWSDHPLVNSPYHGYATSGVADPSKVWLTGRGLKEAVVREEAEFTIDASQAGPGEPDVELTGVRAEIQVFTTPLGGGKFRCTYIPVIPGAYLLNISWNGRQLRGAPYKVNVIGASYPNRVVVNGEGLKGCLYGHNLDFRIDTRKAGAGELTAYCMGPSKVAHCELSDHHDGTYRLVVRPQEVGKHVLQIKYGGEHVQGSPFPLKVSAQPDASKVRVSGPGVEHGILANFQSQFIVETRGAGAGQLTVRIRGPKGAFQVEMYRESQKDRTILCRYYPSVTGLYIIHVRWSNMDVPGSPFHVQILDTQQELEQVLQEQTLNGGQLNTSLPSHRFSGQYSTGNHFQNGQSQQNIYQQNVNGSSGQYQWREEY